MLTLTAPPIASLMDFFQVRKASCGHSDKKWFVLTVCAPKHVCMNTCIQHIFIIIYDEYLFLINTFLFCVFIVHFSDTLCPSHGKHRLD